MMHDLHIDTTNALPELLQCLKAGGYKVVHMVPKDALTTLPKYDDMFGQIEKSAANNRTRQSAVVARSPDSSVLGRRYRYQPRSTPRRQARRRAS